MERKKGQAAMEFLMTYGWAILAALIVIAALAYFGVFSPAKFLPNACTLTAPLGCTDFKVTNNTANIVIRNGVGDSLNILNVTLVGCGENSTYSASTGLAVTDGSSVQINVACGVGLLTTGSKFRGDLRVLYLRSQGTFNSTSTGTISAQVK